MLSSLFTIPEYNSWILRTIENTEVLQIIYKLKIFMKKEKRLWVSFSTHGHPTLLCAVPLPVYWEKSILDHTASGEFYCCVTGGDFEMIQFTMLNKLLRPREVILWTAHSHKTSKWAVSGLKLVFLTLVSVCWVSEWMSDSDFTF